MDAAGKRRRVVGKRTVVFSEQAPSEPPTPAAEFLQCLGPEDGRARTSVYMVTISRVLPDVSRSQDFRDVANLTREEVATLV